MFLSKNKILYVLQNILFRFFLKLRIVLKIPSFGSGFLFYKVFKYSSMAFAARFPAPIALIALDSPVGATSPPA